MILIRKTYQKDFAKTHYKRNQDVVMTNKKYYRTNTKYKWAEFIFVKIINYEIYLRFYIMLSTLFKRHIIAQKKLSVKLEFFIWSEKINASLIFISCAFFDVDDWTFVSAEEKRKKLS